MDEQIRLVPAGASIYLLEIKSTEGISESEPMHLLIREINQSSSECLVPLVNVFPSHKPKLIKNNSNIKTIATSTNDQENLRKKSKKQANTQTQTCSIFDVIKNGIKRNPSRNVQGNEGKQENRLRNMQNKTELNNIQNYGVVSKIFPVEADELICESAVKEEPIFLMNRDEESVTHINVSDKDRSNWLSLLPLGNKNTANVWLYEEDGQIYGITTKLIPSRTPLCLGYSKTYADKHKLPLGQPVLDLEHALAEQPKWWCFECNRAMASASLLLRHMKIYHEDKTRSRRKYRCSTCSRTFCRLFTLRRHVKFCIKKTVKPSLSILKTEQKRHEAEFSAGQNSEDNRIPSDESFQNYTTVLDFSTNLFDPDRISTLDFSVSSKSEGEFDLHSENNEGYTKFYKGLNVVDDEKYSEKVKENTLVTCPHCEKSFAKSAKRRHLRECPARRLECECGKLFTRKEDFAKHIHLFHNPARDNYQIQNEADKADAAALPYKCESCELKFKRRGMLVNHLWRIHNMKSAAVPLERRVKHYPCSVCPKIYRTAAKRDVHVKNHHPGTYIRAAPIEGERRVCQPAKCSACPREYASRSKLLQHIRALHPELVVQAKPDLEPLESNPQNKPLPPAPKEPTLGFY